MTGQRRQSGAQEKGGGRKAKGIVARSTRAAEKVHRAVAGLPLDVLEQIETLKKPVARVRKLQDRSITATYDMVRGIDREVAQLLRELGPDRATKRRAARPRPAPRAKPAAQAVHPPVREATAG